VNPAGTARTQAITHACLPSAVVGRHDGNPAPPRSHRPVRLAITAVPDLMPVSEKPGKIHKTFLLIFLEILLIF
jgi:hypothetical protein